MTISEPKFHVGQYVFYYGGIHMINKILGYQLKTDSQESGWYYEITGTKSNNFKGMTVMEDLLSGDINTEYDRMRGKVLEMEKQLNDMLKRYQNYLSKVDNLIRSKE